MNDPISLAYQGQHSGVAPLAAATATASHCHRDLGCFSTWYMRQKKKIDSLEGGDDLVTNHRLIAFGRREKPPARPTESICKAESSAVPLVTSWNCSRSRPLEIRATSAEDESRSMCFASWYHGHGRADRRAITWSSGEMYSCPGCCSASRDTVTKILRPAAW